METKHQIQLVYEVYAHEDKLPTEEKKLLIEAQKASATAHAPYSNFWVGAAVLLASGKIVIGSNQENAAFPSGICAECTALTAAVITNPQDKIVCIAIAARKAHTTTFLPISPCGNCRQVISEYEAKQSFPIKVIMQGEAHKMYVLPSIETLLPFRFSPESLS